MNVDLRVQTMSDPFERLLNEMVVLDTATPIVYIGTLTEVSEHAFVLTDADVHDCRDGHAKKEVYVAEMARSFEEHLAANRRQVIVSRSTVISVSRLEDVIAD